MPSAWFYAYAWCPHHIFCINNAQLLLLLGSYLNIVFALKVCTYPETVIMLMGRFSLRVVSVFFDDRFLIHKHSDLTIKMCSHMERVIYLLSKKGPRNNLILGKRKRKRKEQFGLTWESTRLWMCTMYVYPKTPTYCQNCKFATKTTSDEKR